VNAPRDYRAFVSLFSEFVSIDTSALASDRSVGGYLALRVAADQFLYNGQHAFDVEFYRDEDAQGGVTTRLMEEPATDVARSWLVATFAKAIVERFMAQGLLDLNRIRTAMAHDELLRVPHGQRIALERASLNAIALVRGTIPSRRLRGDRPAHDIDTPSVSPDR